MNEERTPRQEKRSIEKITKRIMPIVTEMKNWGCGEDHAEINCHAKKWARQIRLVLREYCDERATPKP